MKEYTSLYMIHKNKHLIMLFYCIKIHLHIDIGLYEYIILLKESWQLLVEKWQLYWRKYYKNLPVNSRKALNLREGTFWIMCLAEILDIYEPSKIKKSKSVIVYDLLVKRGLVTR